MNVNIIFNSFFMKSCIGFILDLFTHAKNQFSGMNVEIEKNKVTVIFVGSCGVDTSHGLICDIMLLLQYLSNHEL